MEFLRKSIFGLMLLLAKESVLCRLALSKIFFSQGTQKMHDTHPIKIVSFIQVIKLSENLPFSVWKWRHSIKTTKLSRKLLKLVYQNWKSCWKIWNHQESCLSWCKKVLSKSREEMLHFDLCQPKNCLSQKWSNFSLLTKNVIKT